MILALFTGRSKPAVPVQGWPEEKLPPPGRKAGYGNGSAVLAGSLKAIRESRPQEWL